MALGVRGRLGPAVRSPAELAQGLGVENVTTPHLRTVDRNVAAWQQTTRPARKITARGQYHPLSLVQITVTVLRHREQLRLDKVMALMTHNT